MLWFPSYSPDKILKVKVTMARLKVKSRLHHDAVHLVIYNPQQVSNSYTLWFLSYSLEKIFKGQGHYS